MILSFSTSRRPLATSETSRSVSSPRGCTASATVSSGASGGQTLRAASACEPESHLAASYASSQHAP